MDKHEALDVALGQIERQFGKGSVMRGTTVPRSRSGPSPPARSRSISRSASAVSARPHRRDFGPESSGKTTLGYHVIAEAQRRAASAPSSTSSTRLDPAYASGSASTSTTSSSPSPTRASRRSRSQSSYPLRRARRRSRSIRSRPGHEGRDRRRDGRSPRRPAGAAHEPGAAQARRQIQSHRDDSASFTNQLRQKIGVMFGNPETTPGGRALKFYSSCVRLDIRRIETLKEGVEAFGNRVRVKVVRTGSRRPSSRRSSTSSTAPASPGKARCSTQGSSGRS